MSDGDTRPSRPLDGRSVIVTRRRDQAAALAEPLEALGAEVVAFPVIEIVPPDDWAPVDAAIADVSRTTTGSCSPRRMLSPSS